MALEETQETNTDNQEVREQVRAEVMAELSKKYEGLERNHEELKNDRKAASSKAKELQERLERYEAATNGLDVEEVAETFTKINEADYENLMGKQKIDEAFEVRMKPKLKEFTKQLGEEQAKTIKAEEDLKAITEQLTVLELDNVATEKFLVSKGKKNAIRAMKSQLREDAQRGEDGKYFFPDQFGNPRKDSKGNDLTIDTYVDEVLKVEADYLFTEVSGSGASGSKGASAGSNLRRSQMSPEAAGKFIAEHGQPAYLALQA